MNHSDSVRAAEERLLDAALAQHFASASAAAPPATTPRWLLAALVLLGIVVTAATMWHTRTAPRDEAQDPPPAPLPTEVTGSGKTELLALPVDTENLLAKIVDPRDLSTVTRFTQLRRLRLSAEQIHIAGIKSGRLHPQWSDPPQDLLAPLATLPLLESIHLPTQLRVAPELLAPLAAHQTLREVTLAGYGITIDGNLRAVLAAIPKLRHLHLHGVDIEGSVLEHLTALPLHSLEMASCSGLDPTDWAALVTMRTLQHLSLQDWSYDQLTRFTFREGTEQHDAASKRVWHPTAEHIRALAGLPNLRRLELHQCSLDDEQFAALPETLNGLSLRNTRLTPEGIGALSRLVALRELHFDTRARGYTLADLFAPDDEPAAEAFAMAIPTLRLRSLEYHGALPPSVANAIGKQTELRELTIVSKRPAADTATTLLRALRLHRLSWQAPVTSDLLLALAKQPDLRELELRADDIADVTALAAAPLLQNLTLTKMSIGQGVTTALLAPLASSKSLRTIAVAVSIERGSKHPTEAELQRAVGERIRLRLHRSEFVTGKR
ncbi:MAG: hypothetical protein MUC36_04925 [Planctomycetes bacterium]|jgi:hypothetical protein|nr:hypothetical protein [Planctomycetota bacterium]